MATCQVVIDTIDDYVDINNYVDYFDEDYIGDNNQSNLNQREDG